MVNWATDENCRRCHQMLGRQSSQIKSGTASRNSFIYWSVFIAAVAIPILVGMANHEIGAGLALFFILTGMVIGLFCKVSLIVDMFRISIVWGLAGIFLAPLSTLLFAVNYWDRAKGKILTMLATLVYIPVIFLGMSQMVIPKVAQNKPNPQPAPLTRYLDQTPTPKPDFLQPRANEAKRKSANK